MITVSGIRDEEDRKRVAHAIVTAIGIASVCTQEELCPQAGGNSCSWCAADNHIAFAEGGTDGGAEA